MLLIYLTSMVFPAGGSFASKSVAILKPLCQQARERAPLVHAESGTLVEVAEAPVDVACRTTSSPLTLALASRGCTAGLPLTGKVHSAHDSVEMRSIITSKIEGGKYCKELDGAPM